LLDLTVELVLDLPLLLIVTFRPVPAALDRTAAAVNANPSIVRTETTGPL
jgi:hypothetical protein